ncbi:MAG: radical SAM family heme chaperone HemW [Ignavibacteria bacterium]|nr:radical SAM family heme chaperone HemW [Ignavibacteria bacterium]
MFGLYVHIPFCEKKCIYCDFYSIERTDQIAEFVTTLCREIELRAAVNQHIPTASSVFFGGGTPSLLSPIQLSQIIETIKVHFLIHPDAEWTMECNPGTITQQSLASYKSLGINRLSFGVQSFHESELAFLHRIHTPDEARDAVSMARNAGFDSVSLDLMFALPNQTMESWQSTLETAIGLGPDHISAYSLIFEEGTPLYTMLQRGRVERTGEEQDADMYEYAIKRLAMAGYDQYEVSNFAQSGSECLHNVTYWSGDEYIAFGPSAHGFLNGSRYWNFRSLARYTDDVKQGNLPLANSEKLTDIERMFERAFLELRAKGIRIKEFAEDFGIDILSAIGELALWEKEGLLVISDRITLTATGYQVCDELSLRAIAALEKVTGVEWEDRISAPEEPREDESYFTIL